jgi:hypothetical protein
MGDLFDASTIFDQQARDAIVTVSDDAGQTRKSRTAPRFS